MHPRFFIVAMALSILIISSCATAETFVQLWNEDFTDVSDWSLDVRFTAVGGNLEFNPGGAGAAFYGPNYRSTGGSTWNPGSAAVINVSIENLIIEDIGGSSATTNRQAMWSLDGLPVVSMHDPNAAPNGNDWLEFRVANDGPGTREWVVIIMDDGVQTVQTFAIGSDPQGKNVDINFTANTNAKRYWFNTTIEGVGSASNTGTWTGDGPFAESSSITLTYWSYSSVTAGTPTKVDDMAVYTAAVDAAVVSPPPPPPPSGKAHADFLWRYTSFGVQFSDNSNAPGKIVTWYWNFDDGYGSRNNSRPLHQYPCEGNYTVYLRVTDIYGYSDNVTKQVLINETQLTCGVLQKYDGGVAVNVNGGWITIPQAFFLFLVVTSGLSIAMRLEIPGIPMALRKFFFVISLVMLSLSYGLLTWFL